MQFRSINYIHKVQLLPPSSPESFHLPNWTSVPTKHQLPIPLLQPLEPTILLSVSMDLCALGTPDTWSHAGFVLSQLNYFTEPVLKVHLCCRKCQNFLPFRGWIIFSCVCIPHLACPFIWPWTFRLLLLLLFSRSVMSNSLQPGGLQHTRIPCPSPSPGVYSDSCPLSQWCYLTISSSATPFSFCQSFPASRSFPMSPLFASGGQSVGASASAPILPMNIQGWFPLGLTGFISL